MLAKLCRLPPACCSPSCLDDLRELLGQPVWNVVGDFGCRAPRAGAAVAAVHGMVHTSAATHRRLLTAKASEQRPPASSFGPCSRPDMALLACAPLSAASRLGPLRTMLSLSELIVSSGCAAAGLTRGRHRAIRSGSPPPAADEAREPARDHRVIFALILVLMALPRRSRSRCSRRSGRLRRAAGGAVSRLPQRAGVRALRELRPVGHPALHPDGQLRLAGRHLEGAVRVRELGDGALSRRPGDGRGARLRRVRRDLRLVGGDGGDDHLGGAARDAPGTVTPGASRPAPWPPVARSASSSRRQCRS